jgi:hypothetical protein
MADFNLAYQKIKKTQGLYPFYSDLNRLEGGFVLCSSCFNDEGLRLDAFEIGVEDSSPCKTCLKTTGKKLTKQIVRELCYRFFVKGTIEKFEYGGFPLVQMNEERFGESETHFSAWLENDVKLIEKAGEIGLFYYSPRFWMFGEIEPLKDLLDDSTFENVMERILRLYSTHLLFEEHPFYRIRINPSLPHEFCQFDSPPVDFNVEGRLNVAGEAVLYATPDLELGLHECRASVEDDIYVAKLVPVKPLKMLNLAALVLEEGVDEFNSIDLAIHFLFLAGKHSYPLCTRIANAIKNEGFDGIIYPSYFSFIRTGATPFETINGISVRHLPPLKPYAQSQGVPNVALFGWPIKEGKVRVHSINKIVINSIKYDLSFGPAYHGGQVDKSNKDEFIDGKVQEQFTNLVKAFSPPAP